MEVYFSARAHEDVLNYISTHYPGVAIGIIGDGGALNYALEKQGNKVYVASSVGVDERARLMVAAGGSEAVDMAKRMGVPYIVLSRDIPLSAIQKIGINENQILEYRYPKAFFIDTRDNEFHLQGELTTLSLGVLLESLGIAGSGLRNQLASEARVATQQILKMLSEFRTTQDMLTELKDILERLGGARFLAYLDRFTYLRCASDTTHARFFSIFSLLYLIRMFTKTNFCAILPYMDLVRVRTLCEEEGFSANTCTLTQKDLSYQFGLLDELLPTKQDLMEYLDRFRLECGSKALDFKLLLTNILLAGNIAPKTSMLVDLVECGYIDALLDNW